MFAPYIWDNPSHGRLDLLRPSRRSARRPEYSPCGRSPAKVAGKPIHELLGGARRSRIKAYASTLMPETPDGAAATVSQLLASGDQAVKLGYGPLGRDADLDVALVRAAREAGGLLSFECRE